MKYIDFQGDIKIRVPSETLDKSWTILSGNIKDQLAAGGGQYYQTAKYLNKIIPDYQSFVTHIRFFIENWNDNPLFTEMYESNKKQKKRLAVGQDEDGGMVWLKGQPCPNVLDLLTVVSACPTIYEAFFPKEQPPAIKQEEPAQEELAQEKRYSSYDDDYYFYGYD